MRKTWRAVIVKEQPSNLTYALYAAGGSPRPTGDIVIGGALTETKGPADLPLGTWSFLTAAWDGTTLRLFVNGALVAEKPITGMMSVTAGALRIGGDSVWGEFFKGTIDDVRIYNRGLLGAEIQTDMNAPVR